jgi:hypothetical protein
MNKKLEVLIEAHGYRGAHPEKNYILSNFVKSFVKDYEYFGEATSSLYQAFYGLDEESISYLQSQIPQLKEMIIQSKTPFLFEEKDAGSMWQALVDKEDAKKAGESVQKAFRNATRGGIDTSRTVTSPETHIHIDSPEVIEKPNMMGLPTEKIAPTIDPEALPKVPAKTYIAAAKASTPQEALTTLAKGNGAVISTTTAPVAAGAAAKTGILGILSGLWNKIKSFFGGGVKAIGDTIKTGNYANLVKIPLVQGAMAAGGVALAVVILRKIFGKKKINPQKFNAAAQANIKSATT